MARDVVGIYDVDPTLTGAGLVKRDVEDIIYKLDPDAAPFLTIINNLKATRTTKSRKFEWAVATEVAPYVTLTAAALATDTIINVSTTDAQYVRPNDRLFYQSGASTEVMLVTAVNDGTGALTVVRSYGTTPGGAPITALALPAGAKLLNLGPVYGEKAVVPPGQLLPHTTLFNYAELFQQTVEITVDARDAEYYGGDLRKEEHAKAIVEYLKKQNLAALFGIRHTASHTSIGISGDTGQGWATGGLQYFLTTNIVNGGGVELNYTNFHTAVTQAFRYGSKRKALICSANMGQKIASLAMANIRYKPDDNAYGIEITEWNMGGFTLDIVIDRHLDLITSGVTGAMAGDIAFIVDFNDTGLKKVIKEPVSLKPEVQNKESTRVIKDLYQGVFGWQWGLEKKHAMVYGYTW